MFFINYKARALTRYFGKQTLFTIYIHYAWRFDRRIFISFHFVHSLFVTNTAIESGNVYHDIQLSLWPRQNWFMTDFFLPSDWERKYGAWKWNSLLLKKSDCFFTSKYNVCTIRTIPVVPPMFFNNLTSDSSSPNELLLWSKKIMLKF